MSKKGGDMSEDLKQAWWRFHKENPEVWELFQQYTFQVIARGHKNYSVNAVIERIRWHSSVETQGDVFKINNNHRPYYARYFHHMYPEHDGFFRTRSV